MSNNLKRLKNIIRADMNDYNEWKVAKVAYMKGYKFSTRRTIRAIDSFFKII